MGLVLRAAPKPRKIVISQRQEKAVARQTGGRKIAGSGSSPVARGDVKTEHFLVECKVTEGVSFALRVNHKNGWAPIERKARQIGQEPVMVVSVEGRDLAVTDYQWFLAAKQCYEKNGGRFPT